MTNFKGWLDKRSGPRKLPVRRWEPRNPGETRHWHEAERVEWFSGEAVWVGRCRTCGRNFLVGESEASHIEKEIERHLSQERKRKA